jgi:2-aminoadipate transaminase
MSKLDVVLPTSGAAARVGSSAIRDLLHLTERPEIISLAGGLPSPEAFPVAALAEATAAVLARDPTAALQYATTEGLPALRAWVAGQQAVPTSLDEVLVTHGSQQALDLVVRATLRPGDTVALADPAYVGALQAFRQAGARLEGLPTDHDGIRVDVLADRLDRGLHATLVYVVPDFDNPSGTTLSDERRDALAALADHHGFLIVEDDPYSRLRWGGAFLAPLRARSDRVVSLGTTSKILAPGLRVGWAVAPGPLIRDLVTLKQAADLHTAALNQQIAHAVLTTPDFLEPHLRALRSRYRSQCGALIDALQHQLGDQIELTHPEGGMFCWATLTHHRQPDDLLPRALEEGVAFVPGRAFAVTAARRTAGLRLSFATNGPDDLAEAARRLARALAR